MNNTEFNEAQLLDTPVVAPKTQRTSSVRIPQWSVGSILGVWALAAVPMAMLAWVISPLIAPAFPGPTHLSQALILTLTLGLIWQFVLVVAIIYREQKTLRWPVVRDALWLNRPTSPRSGRRGGRVWLAVIPFTLLFAAEQFIPVLPHPAARDMGLFLNSAAGKEFFSGNWTWFAIEAVLLLFNTVLGEELLFRGVLLPRMKGAFGRGDWVANGVLFALYHVHVWWVIPGTFVDMFSLAYPSRRYRSSWMGIIVHSAQDLFLLLATLALVLH
jgi:uncharacterized protein